MSGPECSLLKTSHRQKDPAGRLSWELMPAVSKGRMQTARQAAKKSLRLLMHKQIMTRKPSWEGCRCCCCRVTRPACHVPPATLIETAQLRACVRAQICHQKNPEIFVDILMFCFSLCNCQLNTRRTVCASFCQICHICRIVLWQASQTCLHWSRCPMHKL